jgi:RimJ/RimL family protein N-acetyltransferase
VSYRIRPLDPADAESYSEIRLDALRLHPEAFSADYADEAALSSAQWADRLAVPGLTRFGGFAGNQLVGLVGLHLHSGAKQKHKAELFSMYVDAAHRRTDLSRMLVAAVVDSAREAGALVLHLCVTVGNVPARRLYQRAGFVVYGIERRALLVDGVFYDEELMALDLRSPSTAAA